MRAEFFQAPTNPGRPAIQNPDKKVPGNQDLTRQMMGEPALRVIYGRKGKRMPVCPDCGVEVGPGEDCFEVELGKDPVQGFLLMGMVVTYRYHARCEEIPWEEAVKRTVQAMCYSLK